MSLPMIQNTRTDFIRSFRSFVWFVHLIDIIIVHCLGYSVISILSSAKRGSVYM